MRERIKAILREQREQGVLTPKERETVTKALKKYFIGRVYKDEHGDDYLRIVDMQWTDNLYGKVYNYMNLYYEFLPEAKKKSSKSALRVMIPLASMISRTFGVELDNYFDVTDKQNLQEQHKDPPEMELQDFKVHPQEKIILKTLLRGFKKFVQDNPDPAMRFNSDYYRSMEKYYGSNMSMWNATLESIIRFLPKNSPVYCHKVWELELRFDHAERMIFYEKMHYMFTDKDQFDGNVFLKMKRENKGYGGLSSEDHAFYIPVRERRIKLSQSDLLGMNIRPEYKHIETFQIA